MTDRRSFLKSTGFASKTYLTAREKEHIEDVNIPAAPYTFEFTITPLWKN